MNEVGQTSLLLLVLFGALFFWPVMRFVVKAPEEKIRSLKWQFWLQILGLSSTFALAQYYRVSGYRDWIHAFTLPYLVGVIGWFVALGLIISISIKLRTSKDK